jgi:transposase-like protein
VAVWMDGMYYKVKVEGKVVTRVLYSVGVSDTFWVNAPRCAYN